MKTPSREFEHKEWYLRGWHDAKALTEPSIPVKEISRLLVNLRKRLIKDRDTWPDAQQVTFILNEVRSTLELRRRSRKKGK